MKTMFPMILLTAAGCAPEAVSPPCWSYCEPVTLYADEDGDGHGDAPYVGYGRPAGYVDLGGDCDDADAATYPGAPELCDGLDTDCDGDASDTGLATFFPRDGGTPEPVPPGNGEIIELNRSGRLLLCARGRSGGVLVSAPDVEVRGVRGANLTALGGLGGDRGVGRRGSVVEVQAPGSAYVTGLTIRGGMASTGGGAYCAGEGGRLVLEDAVVEGNEALLDGGGVAAVGGCALEMYGVQVRGNAAGRDGGGVYLSGVPVDEEHVLDRTYLSGNVAGLNGGGLNAVDSKVTGYATLEARENVAGFAGGGLYVESTTLNVAQVELENNAASYGGGMMLNGATLCADELSVVRNESQGSGGGMLLSGDSFASAALLLVGENSGDPGDGAWVDDASTVTWSDADWYDGIYHGEETWHPDWDGVGVCKGGECSDDGALSASCP